MSIRINKQFLQQVILYPALTSVLFVVLSSLAYAKSNTATKVKSITAINDVRMWSAPESSRVVFDISQQIKHRLFVLHNPERVVVDLFNTRFYKPLENIDFSNSLISSVRQATRNKNNVRIVFDMKSRVQPKSFSLAPNKQYGNRLVIDLFEKQLKKKTVKTISSRGKLNRLREVVIAIDAGHGGEDPGALGKGGTYEKNIVLNIAKRLEKMIQKESGMRPVMIRKGDYFVSLNQRKKLARKYKADMFISIHADSFKNTRVNGASVFALSSKGASSEAARILAQNENAADIIGGVDFDENDSLLTSVLLDLTQTGTIETSMNLGNSVFKEIKKVTPMHKSQVERARFVVLQSLGIPSILIETGFITNRQEEKKLSSWRYQQKVARSILKGAKRFFKEQSPPGTFFAKRNNDRDEKKSRVRLASRKTNSVNYTIRRGDSLSMIASNNNITMSQLRRKNPRIKDKIRIGQVIRLPN